MKKRFTKRPKSKNIRCIDCMRLDIGLGPNDDYPHCRARHAQDMARAGLQGTVSGLQHEITREEAVWPRVCQYFRKAEGPNDFVQDYWRSHAPAAPITTRKQLAGLCKERQQEMLPELDRHGIKVSAGKWKHVLNATSDEEIIVSYGRCPGCGYLSPTWMTSVDAVLGRNVRKLDEFWELVQQLDEFWGMHHHQGE